MSCTVQASLNVRVHMRDGVELSTNVYLPTGPGPYPVMLTRTPYNAMGGGSGVLEWPDRGYAYVTQDVRGRFLSQGEFFPWLNEKQDAEDCLKWIAAQPWCNGNITMYGGSYTAGTQIAAALTGHPALKCVTPALKGGDFYYTCYSGGALRLMWQTSWTLPAKPGRKPEETRDHLPLIDMDLFAGDKENRFWRQILQHPTPDAFWAGSSYRHNLASIRSPMFIRTGWFDLFVHDVMDLYSDLRTKGATGEVRTYTRIVVGPWPHDINRTLVGEADFGEGGKILDLYEQEIAYMDSLTRGKAGFKHEAAPIHLFVMGANQWRDEWEWPLARTVWTELFLSSGGKANTAAGDGVLAKAPVGAADQFDYDPANPVPTRGGAWDFGNIGLQDQAQTEQRADVLVYTLPALTEAMEVTGPIEVRLFASTSGKDTDFTAKLVDVQPDGRAMSVSDGIIRARYRDPQKGQQLLNPGEVYEFTIRLNPTAYLFKKGHQLRLEISSSNFPAFARNLNTGNDIATDTEMKVAHQVIHHSKQYPSRIMLPVIPAAKGN